MDYQEPEQLLPASSLEEPEDESSIKKPLWA
jgi:hypothetical protein